MSVKISDEDSLSHLDRTLTKCGLPVKQENGMYLRFCTRRWRYYYTKKPDSKRCPYCLEETKLIEQLTRKNCS